METGILVSTVSATVICKDTDTAREYTRELLDTALDRVGEPITIKIERRALADIKRFLSGDSAEKPTTEPAKPKAPAAKEKKATADKPAKKPVPKAAPGGKSKKQIVLECLQGTTQATAITAP